MMIERVEIERKHLEQFRVCKKQFLDAARYLQQKGVFPDDWISCLVSCNPRSVPLGFVLGYCHCRYSELSVELFKGLFVEEGIKIYQSKVSTCRFFDNSHFVYFCKTSPLVYNPIYFIVTYDMLHKDLLAATQAAGLERKGAHNFVTHLPRRLMASEMNKAGFSLQSIARSLGQTQISTAKKYLGGYTFENVE